MTARLVASRWLHRRAEPSARERRRRRRCFAASAWFAASGVFLPPLARGAPGDGLASFDPAAAAWLGPLLPTAVEERSELPARRRAPWLGVGAGVTRSPGERRRWFALVELGIPLDTLARPAAAAAADAADADAAAAAAGASDAAVDEGAGADEGDASLVSRPGGEPRPDGLLARLGGAVAASPGSSGFARAAPAGRERGHDASPTIAARSGLAAPAARAARAAPAATASVASVASTVRGARQLPVVAGCADFRSCGPGSLLPLARAAVAEALRLQGGHAELRRLDGMAARSRAAASLPEVRLGAGTSRDESLRLAPTVADPARFTRDGGRDLWLEARLVWRLDGAIFARDEIAIMRLRAQQRGDMARLVSDVLEALVAFERASLRRSSEQSSADERDQALIVQFGALARLDVLTDGWFSRQLQGSAR